ncbi:hypothetical protein ZIOFF_005884 [Zingiber officinale]|uniref:NAF domain-containing protein n=1 Tax=Zingiber officinale TaxID=94328 RepID=A0A8J5M1Y0_ZINOF|nr:hypothetical protein ZIOFF_005884 [Zingiber officinale]
MCLCATALLPCETWTFFISFLWFLFFHIARDPSSTNLQSEARAHRPHCALPPHSAPCASHRPLAAKCPTPRDLETGDLSRQTFEAKLGHVVLARTFLLAFSLALPRRVLLALSSSRPSPPSVVKRPTPRDLETGDLSRQTSEAKLGQAILAPSVFLVLTSSHGHEASRSCPSPPISRLLRNKLVKVVHENIVKLFLGVLSCKKVNEQSRNEQLGPLNLNAFDMIILSTGLNLATLFDRRQVGIILQLGCP